MFSGWDKKRTNQQTAGSWLTWRLVEVLREGLQLETSDHCRSSHSRPELTERRRDTGDMPAFGETVLAFVLADNYLALYAYFVFAAFQH